MADLLQTMVQFANDHWVTLLVGFLILICYRYVRDKTTDCLFYGLHFAKADVQDRPAQRRYSKRKRIAYGHNTGWV